MIERQYPRSSLTHHVWFKQPKIKEGDDVCLFVAYAPDGRFSEHSLIHAQAWANQGFIVVIIAVTNSRDAFQSLRDQAPTFAHALMVRLNEGYDFGAWAAAITSQLPQLRHAELILTVNDSVIGPLYDISPLVEKVRASSSDVIGAVESMEVVPHFQSYMVFFKKRALSSVTFRKFWNEVRNVPKWIVILRYELRLRRVMEAGGLKCEPAFAYRESEGPNPSLDSWLSLVKRGFPFVKVMALRYRTGGQSTENWEAILESYSYDPLVVHRHLSS